MHRSDGRNSIINENWACTNLSYLRQAGCIFACFQGFFYLILEMVVLPQALKMGNAAPYANKKWVACSDNKTVFK